ncbi:MAG: osmotically inducible protein C [Deltaproteobacteria bacterium RIFOXYA12_FULL_61_11]|nr:MAG: osmotically inducible protein C [Deltaproteobacteria bacterium RIFOXYA12_FULL_61_11]
MEMTISFPGGKKVDAAFEGFVVPTDQAIEAGGEGSAPEPFSLFLASLGTCAGLYVLGFLNGRNIPTEGLSLQLSTVWDEQRKLVSDLTLRVLLPAGFPERYKDAVVRAASLCTVKRHLETPPRFHVEAVVQV